MIYILDDLHGGPWTATVTDTTNAWVDDFAHDEPTQPGTPPPKIDQAKRSKEIREKLVEQTKPIKGWWW